MVKRKVLVIFLGVCLLLSGLLILNSYIGTKESGNSFYIQNWGNSSHKVTVKLFTERGISIFNQTYVLVSSETTINHFPIMLEPGMYIEVKLDNNVTKTQVVSRDLIGLVLYIDIDMHSDDPLILGPALP